MDAEDTKENRKEQRVGEVLSATNIPFDNIPFPFCFQPSVPLRSWRPLR